MLGGRRSLTFFAAESVDLSRDRVAEFLDVRRIDAEFCCPRLDDDTDDGELGPIQDGGFSSLNRVAKLIVQGAG